jgi:hypothetical protein
MQIIKAPDTLFNTRVPVGDTTTPVFVPLSVAPVTLAKGDILWIAAHGVFSQRADGDYPGFGVEFFSSSAMVLSVDDISQSASVQLDNLVWLDKQDAIDNWPGSWPASPSNPYSNHVKNCGWRSNVTGQYWIAMLVWATSSGADSTRDTLNIIPSECYLHILRIPAAKALPVG